MVVPSQEQLNLWSVGTQALCISFDGGRVVADTGLLAVRAVEKPLRVIAGLAERLPDPRSPKYIHHSAERILTQEVYQILAGYPDFDDAQSLRDDPLHQILADVSPDADQPLASGSTLARFQYAFTRRQDRPDADGVPVWKEVRAAQLDRLRLVNDYLVDVLVRTRRMRPTRIVLDLDATDDPTHGRQALSAYHGYYRQHQYLPLLVYDGDSGFPLAAWLRPGIAHASWGAVDVLRTLVTRLRAAWPGIEILVRGDNGLAVPALYEYCEAEQLSYVFGYASNAVLERATAQALADVELYHHFYQHREPAVQRFEELANYQAEGWSRSRRVVAKIEINPQGSQRRYVVTNLTAPPRSVYRDVYVQRGAVPEQPIGEMKNGLQADRLSSHRFYANALRLLVHTLAYAVVVLFREALADVPEVATATVSTLRARLWKVGAVLVTRGRRLWLRVAANWPWRGVWLRVLEAAERFVAQVQEAQRLAAAGSADLPR